MLGGILARGSFPRCKSLMKLTKNRIEVVKRKRRATLKFLREDIADLLRNGLEDKAYGRADGLLAELALSECYDFIENACDFVLRHLPALQKIKHCPEDCREAIASLMFAASRFSNLPELRDLRQLFYELYENSVDLYANKKFTENLSAKSFTMEAKIRLLEDIASEYKIDWAPDSFHKKLFVPKIPELKSVASLPKEMPRVAPQEKPEKLLYGRSVSGPGTGNRCAVPPPYTKPNTKDRKWSEPPRHVEERRWSRERELDDGAMLDELLMKYSTTPSYSETVKLKVLEKGGKAEKKSNLPPPASSPTPKTANTSKTPTRFGTFSSDYDGMGKEKSVEKTRLPTPTLTPTPMRRGEADPVKTRASTFQNGAREGLPVMTYDVDLGQDKEVEKNVNLPAKTSDLKRDTEDQTKLLTRAAYFQNGTRQGFPVMPDEDDTGKRKKVVEDMNLPVRASSLTRETVDHPKPLTRSSTFQSGVRHVHPKLPDYDDLAARFASLRGG